MNVKILEKGETFRWYLKSAEGMDCSLRTTKDEKTALKWYLKSAEEEDILYQVNF
ncbi:hypothetical protein Glove_183g64 [Diversispora epigaea]|uniref:Uncharacterized protein n=1 Tax=Diversispora epigaea TaxID=1348612 RepID=A0A397IXA4_9GLOM|nr:hypothetical protein Glove_183g64 [Diversispora epigaea]